MDDDLQIQLLQSDASSSSFSDSSLSDLEEDLLKEIENGVFDEGSIISLFTPHKTVTEEEEGNANTFDIK